MTTKKSELLPYDPADLQFFHDKLKNIGLVRILTIKSSYFRDEILDQVENLEMTLNIENNTKVYTNPEHKQAWAHVHLTLTGKPKSGDYQDKIPFKVEATIEARYTYNGTDLSDYDFSRLMNAFCHTSGLTHTWSFFRQLIVDSLSRMMMPPVMLPLLFNPGSNLPKSITSKGKKT